MKKTTLKARAYCKRLAEKKRVQQTKEANIVKHCRKSKTYQKKPTRINRTISAPEHFGVYNKEKRSVFLDFLAQLRLYSQKCRICTINFHKTKSIDSDGGILLKAEICRLKTIFGNQCALRCKPSKSNKVNQILKQIEIFSDLNYTSNATLTRDDVVHWRCAHGNLVDGEKYEPVLGIYDGRIAEEISTGLYSTLTEAMANSINHAYKYKHRNDGLKYEDINNDWWMFSQSHDNKLHIAFCDLGAGIPETISESLPRMQSAIKRIGLKTDSDIIKFATGTGKSRTEKSYRGKGLPQMLRVISSIPDGKLVIFSNKGMLRAIKGKLDKHEYRKSSILGTLVILEIPLKSMET